MESKWTGVRRATLFLMILAGASGLASGQVRIDTGLVEGMQNPTSKVWSFLGIPFAAPPVGALRWKAPQPAASWTGVRKATEFGARCMQGRIYSDMVFRDSGPSEDCLYLNVWTTSASADSKLPVMVWIYGGGFAAGATSEPRQDGENLSKKGVVVVSCNYRLGVFGFFASSELAAESEQHASGNYGLLDQVAALQWVKKNIAAFGGDSSNVTIFGESAGSFSVSALMASPLAQGLFQKAIGESGAYFDAILTLKPLAEAEAADAIFTSSIGKHTLAELRDMPAEELLQAALKEKELYFAPDVDGYFLPEDVAAIFASGKQSHIPLLAGWNHDEGNYHAIFGKESPSAENYAKKAKELFGDKSAEFLKLYPGATDQEAKRSAQELAGDLFIAFSTWKWIEMQLTTGDSPVYRYEFDDAPPLAEVEKSTEPPVAYHSAEIEFVFEALPSKKLPWRPDDFKLSDEISSYWSNFAKTGNPNGPGLLEWPAYSSLTGYQVMHLDSSVHVAPDAHRARYKFLDSVPLHQP
jgi:para-nitrobenzyl esterase